MSVSDPEPFSSAHQRRSLIVACGGAFLAFVDVTITNLAIPDLANDFSGSSVTTLSWVVTVYAILFAALLAPAGRLADLVGRRVLYASGMGMFTAGSLMAAVAPTFGLLLVARAIQGAGAAALIPASLAIILSDTPPERRVAAIGMWSASASMAAVVGPALGGVLVDSFGWRSLFLITVLPGAWLVWRAIKLTSAHVPSGRLPDIYGTIALALGIGALTLGVTQGQSWSWLDERTLSTFAAAIAFTAVALYRSAHHPAPAIEISLWDSPSYVLANVGSFVFGIGLFSLLLAGVLMLTELWGYSELEAGLAMTPGAATGAAFGVLIGKISWEPSPRRLLIYGGLLFGIPSLVLAATLPSEPHLLTYWLPFGLLVGLSIGMISNGLSAAAALSVVPARFAGAVGLNIAARQIGGAVGVAAMAALLSAGSGVADFKYVFALGGFAGLATLLVGTRMVVHPVPVPVKASAATASS